MKKNVSCNHNVVSCERCSVTSMPSSCRFIEDFEVIEVEHNKKINSEDSEQDNEMVIEIDERSDEHTFGYSSEAVVPIENK